MTRPPAKASAAILTLAALLLVVGFIPGLGSRHLLRAELFTSVIDFRPKLPPPDTKEPDHLKSNSGTETAPPANTTVQPRPASPWLTDASGSLRPFYQALQRTEAHQGVTCVLHYGDSPVTADSITADVRALLQERFGDSGHGFVLIAKPWAWYGHRGVEVRASGWHIEPASQSRAHDGLHGLGGVNFRGDSGARSRITLPDDKHTRVEISYLEQPNGGAFVVKAGDATLGETSTAGPDKKPGFASFLLPPGSRDVIITVKSGSVRLFGASFEKDTPGVIYNSLGLNGGQVQVVLRYFEPNQWAEQLQHQHPDLVIINYGTNESVFPAYIDRYYANELREVLRRVRAAVPNAGLLVMSPMDRGQRDSGGEISTVQVLPRLVDIQRQVAGELGWAFFNTFEAMGGAGTMARWYNQQPRLVSADFMHPLPAGARKVGVLLEGALYQDYQQYLAKTSEKAR